MEVERRPTYALDKNFSFLKKNLLRLFHFMGLVGKISSWLRINRRGGLAIRMSWYAFFEKVYNRGDVYSGLESTLTSLCCFQRALIQLPFHHILYYMHILFPKSLG